MLDFFLQGDHLEFATHHYFFKLLQVENLLLQLGLGFLQVAYHLLIGAHVAQDANRPDHSAIGIAQGRGIERRGNDLAGSAARLRRALRVAPRSITSRRAARNSRVSSGLMKRESDCSSTSSGRNPSNSYTASLACRILPSRSETNTGSGAFLIKLSE